MKNKNYVYLKINLIFLIILISKNLNCQAFVSYQNNVQLKDFNIYDHGITIININVDEIKYHCNRLFGLEKVQLAIQHSRISDIKVVLESPDGTEVWLTNRHGRNGANYTETIFCNSGFRGKIADGTPPFLGEYLPDGIFSNFNNGQNPNGIWKLKIYDLEEGVKGTFESAVLYFSNNPAFDNLSSCTLENPKGCKCHDSNSIKHKDCELLPDLTLIKEITEKEINEIPYSENKGYGELRFGVSTFNKGIGPLEVRGNNIWLCNGDTVQKRTLCSDGTYPRQQVFQTIYSLTKKGFKTKELPAGFNAYDARPGHEHFHSDDYVNYELLVPSNKDTSQWKVACKGTKASFCIWDLSYCRDDLKNCRDVHDKIFLVNDLPNYGFKGYKDCLPEVQGLSVGGVDYYGEGFEGQSIILPKGFKNGLYYLKIEIDPLNLFVESDETNNSFIIPLKINKQSN